MALEFDLDERHQTVYIKQQVTKSNSKNMHKYIHKRERYSHFSDGQKCSYSGIPNN